MKSPNRNARPRGMDAVPSFDAFFGHTKEASHVEVPNAAQKARLHNDRTIDRLGNYQPVAGPASARGASGPRSQPAHAMRKQLKAARIGRPPASRHASASAAGRWILSSGARRGVWNL